MKPCDIILGDPEDSINYGIVTRIETAAEMLFEMYGRCFFCSELSSSIMCDECAKKKVAKAREKEKAK